MRKRNMVILHVLGRYSGDLEVKMNPFGEQETNEFFNRFLNKRIFE